MTFAQKLRELRDAKGLSEAKLADASGVALGALHFYGLGRRKPSFTAVVKLARALGVTCQAFAECEDVGTEAPAPDAKLKKPKGKGESAPAAFEPSAKQSGKRKGK
jgi:transcriptional regulator with XRE-family HTH domain